ncbi:hypothetical protein AB6A40_001109 [Gnathostoma spinigerum]|uniref:Large ribosomal subunit protein uL29m n=1 Tax=Gnathostoma spinigerum TaxID=75299 RepID=A0ABD6EDK8_9BILA
MMISPIIRTSRFSGRIFARLFATKAIDSRSNSLAEFFDDEVNWGKTELRPKTRPGRSWSCDELRLKSNTDLHKLWFVLLKERNMLLTMEEAYRKRARFMPNPERIYRVKESMENIETVVHERNNAFFELETGHGADPPQRTVTSFMGFTFKKTATEHYLPAEVNGDKEYEVPYLDDDAYMMQKLWAEKEEAKKRDRMDDERRERNLTEDQKRFQRSARRTIHCVEQL